MSRLTIIACGAVVVVLAVVAWIGLAVAPPLIGWNDEPVAVPASAIPPVTPPRAAAHAVPESARGFLHGRITSVDGATYEGRLRFGGNEEAFWGDFFNGFKLENGWVAHAPAGTFEGRKPIRFLGFEVGSDPEVVVDRPFMARFGDIARIEAFGNELRVTLKSGAGFVLDRLAADDFADGVRVWDRERGVTDFAEAAIRSIEFMSAVSTEAVPYRLHGTVRTRHGEFTGFLQWDRLEGVGSDRLDGRASGREVGLRFDTIDSITKAASDGVVVTMLDGRELTLSGSREVGGDNRGIYVDDPRFGRVLVSWEAFEQVVLSEAGSGPGYADFPPGRSLMGSVTTRSGRVLGGRLVFDLDESETAETLDAPIEGVDYTIPLGLIATIAAPMSGGRSGLHTVTLNGGQQLRLEAAGDLGDSNLGMLVFVDDRGQAEYVPWTEVDTVQFRKMGTDLFSTPAARDDK